MAGERSTVDITRGFAGDVVGPMEMDEAAHRILAYCTATQSGWGVYDLMGVHARRSGRFEVVGHLGGVGRLRPDVSACSTRMPIRGRRCINIAAGQRHQRAGVIGEPRRL